MAGLGSTNDTTGAAGVLNMQMQILKTIQDLRMGGIMEGRAVPRAQPGPRDPRGL